MKYLLTFILCLSGVVSAMAGDVVAEAPAFRDPVTDGAADPCVVFNRGEKMWYMFYTQRRANTEACDVAYCYGNKIGVACTDNNGRNWYYRGTLDLDFEPGHNTFWAPDVVYQDGTYHMFVTYIQGVRNHWSGASHIMHCASNRRDDGPSGSHGDVVVVGDRAWVFYFTHPGRKRHPDADHDANDNIPYEHRRSSIQVAELEVTSDGKLQVKDRNAGVHIWLPNEVE
ncbi:MAG: hypothetical protein MJZ74_11000 [Muribaculaceae bacterium]|nr:hypothetical protein [Muribaculaceae bacterium]